MQDDFLHARMTVDVWLKTTPHPFRAFCLSSDLAFGLLSSRPSLCENSRESTLKLIA
jgi:hypothetical protein